MGEDKSDINAARKAVDTSNLRNMLNRVRAEMHEHNAPSSPTLGFQKPSSPSHDF